VTKKTTTPTAPSPSLAAWQARALHTITLPSGQRVKIRIPGIATLLEHGDLPEDLAELALLELTSEGGATAALAGELAQASENGARAAVLERIARYGEFQRNLVCAAVVAVETAPGAFEDVSLTPETLMELGLPEDDLALVAEIIQRLRAHDARGVRIGVEPLDRWATFREAHGCPDQDCPGCAKLVAALSSVDLGEV
jgi:hypothetical protein